MQEEVQNLICAGLAERFGFNDPALNPDLADIVSSYSGATFLVATSQGCIVGTGALVEEDATTGRIVRMSVDSAHRGNGIGSAILDRLIQAATASKYSRLVLETTADWEDAIGFYRSHGFQRNYIDRVNNEAHFELQVGATPEAANAAPISSARCRVD